MIISQEISNKNKAKMVKVGGNQANRFLQDPKFNEHKIIGEKFQRKKYKSLAVDLYKSKLANNPMRTETKLLAIEQKENMPPILNVSSKVDLSSAQMRQNHIKVDGLTE